MLRHGLRTVTRTCNPSLAVDLTWSRRVYGVLQQLAYNNLIQCRLVRDGNVGSPEITEGTRYWVEKGNLEVNDTP